MDGEEPTCGEGQHDWVYENEDDGVHCYQCDAEAIDCSISEDGYVSDGEWCSSLHIEVHTHTYQLDDALKAAREAPKTQGIVWDKLEPREAPKVTTQPRLLVEISDDENVLQQYEE